VFTGIVETLGSVESVHPGAGLTRLGIASDLPLERVRDGDSIAVDGVCLSVVGRAGRRFEVEAVAETLARTTLGDLRQGSQVNLERSLAAGEPLGGHLVQGHVDAPAPVLALTRGEGGVHRLVVGLPEALRRFLAPRGAIAVHGVSLTVWDLPAADRFEVVLVPRTLERTTLGRLEPGDRVNLEVDLLARYLDTLLEARG
jgi:riboflavin synthase